LLDSQTEISTTRSLTAVRRGIGCIPTFFIRFSVLNKKTKEIALAFDFSFSRHWLGTREKTRPYLLPLPFWTFSLAQGRQLASSYSSISLSVSFFLDFNGYRTPVSPSPQKKEGGTLIGITRLRRRRSWFHRFVCRTCPGKPNPVLTFV
jgi:hypothetical protein